MKTSNVYTLALSMVITGCAGLPSQKCLQESAQAEPVLQNGFAEQPWAARRQWDDLLSYLRCTHPTPSVTIGPLLESLPGIERVIEPSEVRTLYLDRQQWRESMLRIAGKTGSTRIERAVARDDEKDRLRKDAFELYQRMWKKKDYSAGHDIAFGLLHGWDGGKPDAHAARYWYAVTFYKTGRPDSLQACQALEKDLKRASGATLEFCQTGPHDSKAVE